jgi:hypothetical protein
MALDKNEWAFFEGSQDQSLRAAKAKEEVEKTEKKKVGCACLLHSIQICIQGVPGGMCQTSGGCSLC